MAQEEHGIRNLIGDHDTEEGDRGEHDGEEVRHHTHIYAGRHEDENEGE